MLLLVMSASSQYTQQRFHALQRFGWSLNDLTGVQGEKHVFLYLVYSGENKSLYWMESHSRGHREWKGIRSHMGELKGALTGCRGASRSCRAASRLLRDHKEGRSKALGAIKGQYRDTRAIKRQ